MVCKNLEIGKIDHIKTIAFEGRKIGHKVLSR